MKTQVNWNTYAQKYDMLLSYNPFYGQLQQEVIEQVKQWQIQTGDLLADFGAGTGNYSLALAREFPQATVLHIDKDQGMNEHAAQKAREAQLFNHKIRSQGIGEVQLRPHSLSALISIHALYTFPYPQEVIKDLFHWLKPGGSAILVDAGRVLNVLDWQLALGSHLVRQHGLRKTLEIFREGKEVSRQNAYIRKMQKAGEFWTHSHEEFIEKVRDAGFEIKDSKTCYRGISDMVVAYKPSSAS